MNIYRLWQYGQGIYTAGLYFTVSDGQDADQDTFNNAFMSRTANTSTTGQVDLDNADAASGATIANAQRSLNGVHNFVGSAPEGAQNQDPSWTSDTLAGTVANESVKDRVDAIQAAVEDHESTKVDKVTSTDNAIAVFDGTGGDLQDSSVTISGSSVVTNTGDFSTQTGDFTTQSGDLVLNRNQTLISAQSNAVGMRVDNVAGTDVLLRYDSGSASSFSCGPEGSEENIVTTTATQALTAKDIDGGTASDTSRITLPKNTTANLSGLSNKEGTVAYDTTLGSPVYNNGSSWQQIGSSEGGGTKSWLTGDSSNFEGNTVGGWSAFDDGSVTTPVDGTGGSPANISLAVTSSAGEVLEGSFSLKITKANTADAQGEGVSVDFDIDYAEQGKMQQIPFLIKSGSGFVNSMFKVFVYDKTNTEILNVMTLDGGSGELYATPSAGSKFTGSFIPNSDSTSYRLIIMCVTTDTDDFEFYIDEVKPGPVSSVNAFNSHDPIDVTYTTGLTGGSGITATGKVTRMGKWGLFEGKVTWTTAPTGGSANINLPSGYTIDVNALSDSTPDTSVGHEFVGKGNYGDVASAGYDLKIWYASTTAIKFYVIDTSAAYTFGQTLSPSGSRPAAWANGDFYQFSVWLPIEEWTSSDVMSTMQADLRTLKFSAYLSGAQTVTGDTGTIPVEFDTIDYSTHGSGVLDTTTNVGRFIAPFSSYYRVTCNIRPNSITADSLLTGYILSTNATELQFFYSDNYTGPNWGGSKVVYLAKGEEVWIATSSADGTYTFDAAAARTWFQVESLPDFSVFGVKGVYEVVSADSGGVYSNYTITAGTFGDLTSITLSPGTWAISGKALFYANGAVTTTECHLGLDTTSGTSHTNSTAGVNSLVARHPQTSGSTECITVNDWIQTITTETTFYLKARALVSITNLQTAYSIQAVRLK